MSELLPQVVESQRSCIEPVLSTSAQRDGSIPDVRQNVIGVNFELGRTKAQPFMIASYFLAQRDVLQRRVEQLTISCVPLGASRSSEASDRDFPCLSLFRTEHFALCVGIGPIGRHED